MMCNVQQTKVRDQVVHVKSFFAPGCSLTHGLGGRGGGGGCGGGCGGFRAVQHEDGGRLSACLSFGNLLLDALDLCFEGGDITSFFASCELVVGAGALRGPVGLLAGGACRQLAVTLDLGGTTARAGGDGPAYPKQRRVQDHGVAVGRV